MSGSNFHCHYPQYGNSILVRCKTEFASDHGEIAGRATAAQARPAARRNARTIFGAVCETLGAFAALRSRLLSRALLQACKQSGSCVFHALKTFLRFAALVHDKDSTEGTHLCAQKEFPKPEKKFPRMT